MFTLKLLIFIPLICTMDNCGMKKLENEIVWFGTEKFNHLVEQAVIHPQQARQLLVQATEGSANVFFDRDPLFVFDGYYFFTIPEKSGKVLLEGYYVHFQNGNIEFRESTKQIEYKSKYMPSTPFYSVKTVKQDGNE